MSSADFLKNVAATPHSSEVTPAQTQPTSLHEAAVFPSVCERGESARTMRVIPANSRASPIKIRPVMASPRSQAEVRAVIIG